MRTQRKSILFSPIFFASSSSLLLLSSALCSLSVPFKWRRRLNTRTRMSSCPQMYGLASLSFFLLLSVFVLRTLSEWNSNTVRYKSKFYGAFCFVSVFCSCCGRRRRRRRHHVLHFASFFAICLSLARRARLNVSFSTVHTHTHIPCKKFKKKVENESLCVIETLYSRIQLTTTISFFVGSSSSSSSFSLDGFHFNLGAVRVVLHFMHILVEVKSKGSADTRVTLWARAHEPKPKGQVDRRWRTHTNGRKRVTN